MVIREIPVRELVSFTESDLFSSLSPRPLTVLRAVSQFHNPRAHPDDIALVIAFEGNTLLAMAGLLPDYVSGNPGCPASSNSGWWAHPEKGRPFAMAVFARALKCCQYRMFLTDCTPRSKEILEKTGWFEFPSAVKGVKNVFRFYFGQLAERRLGKGFVSKTCGLADTLLNALYLPMVLSVKQGRKKNSLSVTAHQDLDERLTRFMERHNGGEFTRRSAGEISWILSLKWLQTGNPIDHADYPFSVYAGSFSQPLLEFSRDESLIALALLNIRDNHATVPYFWSLKGEEEPVWETLFNQLARMKINTLTCYRPDYLLFSGKRRIPVLFKKQVLRHIAFSKELLPLFLKNPGLQDGDGDCAFT